MHLPAQFVRCKKIEKQNKKKILISYTPFTNLKLCFGWQDLLIFSLIELGPTFVQNNICLFNFLSYYNFFLQRVKTISLKKKNYAFFLDVR